MFCQKCEGFIWGVRKQGKKCSGKPGCNISERTVCNMIVHHKCAVLPDLPSCGGTSSRTETAIFMKPKYLEEGQKAAQHAVWLDFSGNLEDAAETYEKAISFLLAALKGMNDLSSTCRRDKPGYEARHFRQGQRVHGEAGRDQGAVGGGEFAKNPPSPQTLP